MNALSTFLVSLNTARKVDTAEHGMVRGLLIANPAEVKSKALAKEYLDIAAGDEIIACSEGGVRWRANVDEVIDATVGEGDEDSTEGDPVRVDQGHARRARQPFARRHLQEDEGRGQGAARHRQRPRQRLSGRVRSPRA